MSDLNNGNLKTRDEYIQELVEASAIIDKALDGLIVLEANSSTQDFQGYFILQLATWIRGNLSIRHWAVIKEGINELRLAIRP